MNGKNIYLSLIDILFPRKCLSCGKIIENNLTLCKECKSKLKFMPKKDICTKCGLIKPSCDCKRRIFYFEGIVSPFANTGSARNIVYRYKFLSKRHYAKFMARAMVNRLKEILPGVTFGAVIPVPTKYKDIVNRGFDHTELLAKEVSRLTDIPCLSNAIGVKLFGKTQHKIKAEKRFDNVDEKYFAKTKIKCKRVLLVDDIKTTGATLNACSRELLKAGAEEVYCLTALVGAPRKK